MLCLNFSSLHLRCLGQVLLHGTRKAGAPKKPSIPKRAEGGHDQSPEDLIGVPGRKFCGGYVIDSGVRVCVCVCVCVCERERERERQRQRQRERERETETETETERQRERDRERERMYS